MAPDVDPRDLDPAVRARLRGLGSAHAADVARHLVMADRFIEDDPDLAYAHAIAAVRRAARIDVVREAAGIAAYRSGRFAEAIRELRTARRLSGSDEHVAILADCERGLGRPERALAVAAEHGRISPEAAVELAIVVSGARLDLGDPEAALAALEMDVPEDLQWRVAEARQTALEVAEARQMALEVAETLKEAP